ncbi:MAG: hypothetical protein E3J72_11165 [Planctomycetota bacterium]|nr:MAG: hypothetical protein E3J72_11165 [Planctomycetota bacterium]
MYKRNIIFFACVFLIALPCGCSHFGDQKVERIRERVTGKTRNETVSPPRVKVVSTPTSKSPFLRLAVVRTHSIEREYAPIFEEVRYSEPYSFKEEFDEQCWGCVVLPVNIGKALVSFLLEDFWKPTYERYAPYVNIDPRHYQNREVLKEIEGAPFFRKETKDEILQPPAGLITMDELPFPPELVETGDNSITLDVTALVRRIPMRPWTIMVSDPRLQKPLNYSPGTYELETFEFEFGREWLLANSSDADKLRRYAGRALDDGNSEIAVKYLERAVLFEKDVTALLQIGILAAPHCASLVRVAVEKTKLDIPGSIDSDTLLIIGASLCSSNCFELGGDVLDLVEDREPLSKPVLLSLAMGAQKDIFRGATYAYALNRVGESKNPPGDAMLKAYTSADGFANIDLKLSILKNPPAKAKEKWDTAVNLFNAKKFEKAVEILAGILVNKRYPREVANGRALCYKKLAEAAFERGDLNEARSNARKMVRVCPNFTNIDKTLSDFFAQTGIAELVKEKPDLHAALRDFRTSVRLTLNGEALAGLVETLWQTRKLGAAARWAMASSKLVAKNKYAAALAAFIGKVKARDFPGAEKALSKLRDAASEGNESVFAELFKHELEWEKYIAEQGSKGRSYESIIKDVDKYRSESDAFRKAAGRTTGKLPGGK